MENILDHQILCTIIIVILIIISVFILIPKKKLCKHCGSKKTRNKNAICDDCRNKLLLEKAKQDRHVEIRREFEREATSYLEHTKPQINLNLLSMKIPKAVALNNIETSWFEFFSTFTLMDYVTGLFSLVALSFGSVYFIWRNNPFAAKIEK